MSDEIQNQEGRDEVSRDIEALAEVVDAMERMTQRGRDAALSYLSSRYPNAR